MQRKLTRIAGVPGTPPRDNEHVRKLRATRPEYAADVLDLSVSKVKIRERHGRGAAAIDKDRALAFGIDVLDSAYEEHLRNRKLSNGEVARLAGNSRDQVSVHRRALGIEPSTAPLPAPAPATAFHRTIPGAEGDSHSVNDDGSENWSIVGQRPWGREQYEQFIRDNGDDPERTHFTYGWTSNPHGGGWNKLNNVRPKTPQELLADDLTLDLPTMYARAAALESDRDAPLRSYMSGRTLFVNLADWQIGKTGSRGGTPELAARLHDARVALQIEIERRKPSLIVVIDLGDGIENFESGGNPAFTNDLSLPDQLDMYATELFAFVELCARYAPVKVGIVPSNHSAWRRGKQQLGRPTDDFGIHVHRQVEKTALAAGLDVEWSYPAPFDEAIVVAVPGEIIGAVHGNQYGPNGAIQFWERQAFGGILAPAGVLLTGHYHTYACLSAGVHPVTGRERWWLQAPTNDAGSDWFRNLRGRESLPGTLIFEVDPESGFDLRSIAIL